MPCQRHPEGSLHHHPTDALQNCEKKIKGNLRFEKGVKKIVTNIEQQTVTIEYDADKVTVNQLLKAFSKAGYEARKLKEGEKPKKN